MTDTTRRAFLGSTGVATAGVAAATALAGCALGSGDVPDGDVDVGPGGSNAFDPEAVTIPVGETVTWVFASPGHNVSCVPEHSTQAALPEGAEPFASYGTDGSPNQTDPQGDTFEHTFETAGEYTYVCVPHVRQGMVGTVTVEE